MATIHVDTVGGNNANSGASQALAKKTITAAITAAVDNDQIRVYPGTYHETVTLNKNGLVVYSATPYAAIIDGGYHAGLMSSGVMPPPAGYLPGAEFDSMVTITADGCTFKDFKVQNIAGEGIVVAGNYDSNTIQNNIVDHCYGGFINVQGATNSGALDNIVRGNDMKRGNAKKFDPTRSGGGGPARVQVGLFTMRAKRTIIEDNKLGWNHAEGIAAGKGCQDTVIRRNLVYNTSHVSLYVMRSIRTKMYDNVVIHTGEEPYTSTNTVAPDGIGIGDEGDSLSFGPSSDAVIYNNLVIGSSNGFTVRASGNYTTILSNTYIGYNTFVNCLDEAVLVQPPGVLTSVHATTLIENNVISQGNGQPVSAAHATLPGVLFRSNTWSSQPATGYRGTGDQYGAANLANQGATISAIYPNLTGFNKNNYRLTGSSTRALDNAATGAANGVTPPTIATDNGGSTRQTPYDRGAFDFSGVVTGTITAEFISSVLSGNAPLTVIFTDSSTAPGGITSRAWNFGDSSTSTLTSPTHIFTAPGTYTVTLTVTGPDGTATATSTITATDPGTPPPTGDPVGWTGINGAIWETVDPYNGAKVLRINTGLGQWASNAVTVDGGSRYRLAAYVKGVGNAFARLGIRWYDEPNGSGNLLSGSVLPLISTSDYVQNYVKVQGDYTAPADALSAQVVFRNAAADTTDTWADDFNFNVLPSGTNLLANPSVEAGSSSPTSWVLTGATWETGTGKTGTRYLRVTNDTTQKQARAQWVPVTANSDYAVSCWAKETAGGNVGLVVQWFSDAGGIGNLIKEDIYYFTGVYANWTQISTSFRAPASAQSAYVCFRMAGWVAYDLRADSFSLRQLI